MTRFDSSRPFGVVCRDPGGANQIVAMLRRLSWRPAWAVMEGPAESIWRGSFPGTPLISGFHWVSEAYAILTGTGWSGDLEHNARIEAQRKGCYSIAVIDHWTNYRERFMRNGLEVLPDELWVVDDHAKVIAKRLFPKTTVILQPDYYLELEAGQVTPLTKNTPKILLYLLEPIRSDWGRGEPGEFQALRFFFDHVSELGLPTETRIQLRLHPSEIPGKYDSFLENYKDLPVCIAPGTLAESLSSSRWVAGCQTYAMTIALRTGRKVFGSLPPWAPECILPHQEIIHLRVQFPL